MTKNCNVDYVYDNVFKRTAKPVGCHFCRSFYMRAVDVCIAVVLFRDFAPLPNKHGALSDSKVMIPNPLMLKGY